MDILEAIKARHSVRTYTDKPISIDMINELNEEISACNKKASLHIQLIVNETEAFDSLLAHYGKFSGVRNYIALVGPKSADLDEKLGYYGEHLVLKAQQMGLNTCWVAVSFSKSKTRCIVNEGEKLVCVISLGYGTHPGIPHKSKTVAQLCQSDNELPDWFISGVEAAALAPTAMNQQKFLFSLTEGKVTARTKNGFYTKIDLGIAKYHFEIGSGRALTKLTDL